MSANLNQGSGSDNSGWLILLALIGVAWAAGAFGGGASDKAGKGERKYFVDYTSPDEEYSITVQVYAKTKAAAIAEAKRQLKSEGEEMRGAEWDAIEADD
jgi:hypothetical protein